MLNRDKQIKLRAKAKEQARDKFLTERDIELMKKVELNKLKTIDVEENLNFQRKKKQQMQDYWYKTEYLKCAFNVEADHQVSTLIEDTKIKTQRKEQEASQINPRMEVSFMKPEQLF